MINKELIDSVINGVVAYAELPMMPIQDLDNYMKSLGFTDGEYETNGWQCDFWKQYNRGKTIEFVLGGSLYYGGFVFGKYEP